MTVAGLAGLSVADASVMEAEGATLDFVVSLSRLRSQTTTVTDAVLEEVREWQSRPLDAVYPVVFFDALRVKCWWSGRPLPAASQCAMLAVSSTPREERGIRGTG